MHSIIPRGRLFHGLSVFLLSLAVVCATGRSATAQELFHPALNPQHFPVPQTLVPAVEFWRNVFSRYGSTQTVIHDDLYLDVVFSVVDVGDLVRNGDSAIAVERAQRDRVRREVRRYQQVLRRLAGDRRVETSPADVDRVRALYANSAKGASDFRAAVGRVRGQGGLKDRFAEAIATSGMFMPRIERILAQHGVPAEVRCLPFVESMFNYKARSKVGASGVWQFTASTGRRYLQMDSAVDERSDVWLAADGAARLLVDNYNRVESWPLALTGYNHGIAGMARAARQVGTSDIGVIVERYGSRSFGFASRNFYAEFVAAVTVFSDRERLFPGAEPLPPVRFEEFKAGHFVSLLDLAHLTGTDLDRMMTLNPALHEDVARGELLIPATYPLRVPEGRRGDFESALAQLPASRKRDRQLSISFRVRRGDTLSGIARKFGTSTRALQRANGLPRADRIYPGQTLEVRSGSGSWNPLVWTPDEASAAQAATEVGHVHVVRSGETIARIASRYGLTIAELAAANKLTSPDRISVGLQLLIPGPVQARE